MIFDATAVDSGDPTWYLILDLVGTWMGALGTMLAAGVAVWLGLKAMQDQRAQREDQVRVQAERVMLLRRTTAGRPHLTVRNDSDLSISAVRVVAVGTHRDELDEADLLPPGGDLDWHLSGLDHRKQAVVEFDDASHRTWVRRTDGELVRTHRQKDGDGSSLHLIYRENSDPAQVEAITAFLPPSGRLVAFRTIASDPPPKRWPVQPRRSLKSRLKIWWPTRHR